MLFDFAEAELINSILENNEVSTKSDFLDIIGSAQVVDEELKDVVKGLIEKIGQLSENQFNQILSDFPIDSGKEY